MANNVTSIRVGAGRIYGMPYEDARDFGDLEKILAFTASPDEGVTPAEAVDCGWTQDGIEFEYDPTISDIYVDQLKAPVLRYVEQVAGTLSTQLAEISLRNFQMALGGGTITTNTASKTYTPPTDIPGEMTMIWVAQDAQEALAIPKVSVGGGITIGRTKDDNAKIPVEFVLMGTEEYEPFYYSAALDSGMAADAGIFVEPVPGP